MSKQHPNPKNKVPGKRVGGRSIHNERRDKKGIKRASRRTSRMVTRREMTQQDRRRRRGLGVNEEAVP